MSKKIALQTLAAVFLNSLQHQSPLLFIVDSYDAKSGQLIGVLGECTSYQQFWQLYKNNDLSEKEKIDTYWRIYLGTNCGPNCLLFLDFLQQVVESGAVIIHKNREISLNQIYISKCMMTIEDIKPRIKFKIYIDENKSMSYEMFHTLDRNLSEIYTNSENYRRTMLMKKEIDKIDEMMHKKAVTHFFISIAPAKQHSDMIIHLDFSGISYCGKSPLFTNKVRYYQVSNCKVPISIYETKHLQIKSFQNDKNLILTRTKAGDDPYYQILCIQIRAFEYALKLKDRPYFPIVLSRPKDFKKVRMEELGEQSKTLAQDFTQKCLEECNTTALPKGSDVLLCGLKKTKSLNGTIGKIITALNVSKQRYGVQTNDGKRSMSINNIALMFPSWYLNEQLDSIKY
eukprot:318184_1